MSLEVITSLLHKMTVKTYLENAIISKFGLVNDFIYFLYSGTVAVYSKEGHEVCIRQNFTLKLIFLLTKSRYAIYTMEVILAKSVSSLTSQELPQ